MKTSTPEARKAHADSHRQPSNLSTMKNQTASTQELKNKVAHTPGPWSASHNGNDDVRIFANSVSDSPRCIAKVNTPLSRGLESCANARLIAASPRLLNELKDLSGFVAKFGDTMDRAAFMRAAEGYLQAARLAIQSATL